MFYQVTFAGEQTEWVNTVTLTLPDQQSAGLQDVYCHLRSPEISGDILKQLEQCKNLQHQKGAESRFKSRQVMSAAIGGNGEFDH